MIRFLFILGLLLLMAGCSRDNKLCLKKAGIPAQSKIDLDAVSSLDINDEIDVEFYRDTGNYAVIKAGNNIIPMISFELQNNAIVLTNNSGCNWYRNYEKNKVIVEIHSSTISDITINNGSNFSTPDTIHSGNLTMNFWESGGDCQLKLDIDTLKLALHTGPTTIDAFGNIEMAYFYSAGDARINAYELETINADVHHAGVNDYFLNCTGNISIQLRSIGNIFVKGSPSIISETITGSGSLVLE